LQQDVEFWQNKYLEEVQSNRCREDALLSQIVEKNLPKRIPATRPVKNVRNIEKVEKENKQESAANDVFFEDDAWIANLANQLYEDDPSQSVTDYVQDIKNNREKYQDFIL